MMNFAAAADAITERISSIRTELAEKKTDCNQLSIIYFLIRDQLKYKKLRTIITKNQNIKK